MDEKKNIFIRCCYGYGVSGMAVLVIGAILPLLIKEAGISFSVAGGLLSAMAIGNLLASLAFPFLEKVIGKRWAITLMSVLISICYFLLSFLPSIGVLYLLMLLAGMGKGSITILNNASVNKISNNSTKMLNLLHCSFAVGAFLAPFLTALLVMMGFGWRTIIRLIVVLCISSVWTYATMPYTPLTEDNTIKKSPASRAEDLGFLKSVDFYCICMLLFFYLGVENCINGWFVTYLQSTGVMSEAFATTMVSVTWMTILAGRLACASFAKKYSQSTIVLLNAIGSGVCFLIMVMSSSLLFITLGLIGMGFCLAGIYPTSVANAGPIMKNSTLAMSILTAVSALGGIITPQLIGIIADQVGIVASISILGGNLIMVVLLAIKLKKKTQICS